MQCFLCLQQQLSRPVARKIFASPLEKRVGHNLKLLETVSKFWASLRILLAPLASQAGYGPSHIYTRG